MRHTATHRLTKTPECPPKVAVCHFLGENPPNDAKQAGKDSQSEYFQKKKNFGDHLSDFFEGLLKILDPFLNPFC